MVFYFTSEIVSPPFTIFMGLDKFESECSTWILMKIWIFKAIHNEFFIVLLT